MRSISLLWLTIVFIALEVSGSIVDSADEIATLSDAIEKQSYEGVASFVSTHGIDNWDKKVTPLKWALECSSNEPGDQGSSISIMAYLVSTIINNSILSDQSEELLNTYACGYCKEAKKTDGLGVAPCCNVLVCTECANIPGYVHSDCPQCNAKNYTIIGIKDEGVWVVTRKSKDQQSSCDRCIIL